MKNFSKLVLSLGMVLVFISIISSIDAAQCVASTADEFFTCGENTNCEFGVGNDINDVSLNFKLLKDQDSVSVNFFLYRGEDRISQKTGVATKKGEYYIINLGCEDSTEVCLDTSRVTYSGDNYYLRAVIDPYNRWNNDDGINKTVEKDISFKKSLQVLLNCPIEAFVDQEVECTFEVKDIEEPTTLVSYTPSVIVEQGGISISSQLGTDSVVFSGNELGDVYIEVMASAAGYISGSDFTQVIMSRPEKKETLLINGKTLESYSGLGVTPGTHEITIKIEKGGKSFDVNNIDAVLETPSGQKVPLTLQEVSEGTFKTNVNLEQVGTTYFIKGTVYPEDESELPFTFQNSIVIAGKVDQANEQGILWIVIGSSAGLVFFVIIVIVLLRLGKRKRK